MIDSPRMQERWEVERLHLLFPVKNNTVTVINHHQQPALPACEDWTGRFQQHDTKCQMYGVKQHERSSIPQRVELMRLQAHPRFRCLFDESRPLARRVDLSRGGLTLIFPTPPWAFSRVQHREIGLAMLNGPSQNLRLGNSGFCYQTWFK